MKLTFRSKFVIINLALVLFTMIFLAVIVIQGLIHYNIESAQKRLSQDSNQAVLYIQQEIKGEAESSPEKYEELLLNKSLSIAETLSNINYTRLLIYDAEGNFITDSANVEVATDIEIDSEIATALKLPKGKSVSVFKKVEDLSRIYSATPIYIDDVEIGVIAFIYSLESMDIIISQIITLFIVSSLISMIILFILSNYLAKSTLKPIRLLVDSTKKISQGYYAELIEYGVNDEIGELTSNFNRMILNISDEVTKIEEEKQKLSAIISSIDDGIFAVSLENSILMVNEKAKEMLNLKGAITTSSLNTVPFINQLVQDVATGKNDMIKEIDFSNKHLLLFASLIINNENSLGILVVIRDNTKLYGLEKQQKKFISNVSHELRTPLTTIIGYTDLLQRRGTDNLELLNKSIDTINREGKRLLRLVEDLLSMSKYDQLDFNLIFTGVDINTLLEDVISQMKIKSQKYDVDINYNVLELPTVRGDYDRLKQVFINIIDNSIKYSDHGDIINVVATHYENYVEVSIRDFGPGIPEKDLVRIFDAFYRVDENRSREFGGTGLGLSIVKSIVDRHHGQVHMESKDNEGTMVVVKLLKENNFT